MRLSDDHVQFLVYQMFRGLKYVHSAGIIHRVGVRLFNSLDTHHTAFANFILRVLTFKKKISFGRGG